MKQNITLSIEKDLLQKARVLAAERQTSVSRMLGMELERIVSEANRYEKAKRSAIQRLKEGYHFGGSITVTRDELHER